MDVGRTVPNGDGPGLQAERLQTLTEISRAVSSTLELRALYDTIYQEIGRVMDVTQFFITLRRPESDVMDMPYLREDGDCSVNLEVAYGGNVTSQVIEQGTALLFEDDDAYLVYAQANGLPKRTVGNDHSEAKIFVPLHNGSRAIGALSVQSTRRHAYTQEDLQTLAIIAAQAAVAIENAKLYEQSQALLHVARLISSTLELSTVLDAILGGMRNVIPYHVAAVLLPDRLGEHLEIVGSSGHLAEERRRTIKVPYGAGVTGAVYGTGEPVVVQSIESFPGYLAGSTETRSEMAVPLKRGDVVIGVLDVERTEPNAFSASDLTILTLFASQAAIAIENARLFAAQERRVTELQTIQGIVHKLTPLHDIQSIVGVIDTELAGLIDYHACHVFLLDAEANVLQPVIGGVNQLELQIGEGITGWIAHHGRSQIVPSTLHDDRILHIPGIAQHEQSILGVPLLCEGHVRGVITLSQDGADQFDDNALRLLEIIAAQAALAFERVWLYEELRLEATTDALTKLHNRRFLLDRLREEQSRASRYDKQLAAIMLDIDKFKTVNDNYGHDAGDAVLVHIADILRNSLRAEDVVSRYGGEEFCVLLPDTTRDGALQAAERLRARAAGHPQPSGADIPRVTVSIGISFHRSGEIGSGLLTRADHAQYKAKHHGGNAVWINEGETGLYPSSGPGIPVGIGENVDDAV